jgi:hypothetical protein
LLLQRLAQLVEQARVLDGDDRLFRKVANKLDLLVGKRPDFLTRKIDSPNQLIIGTEITVR